MDSRSGEEQFDVRPAERKEIENRLAHYRRSLTKLLDVSHAITVTTDLKKLYRSVIATARDLLSLDFSTIMVLSEDKQELTIMDTLGFPVTMINTFHLVKGQGLSTYVVQNARPGVVNDFPTEKRFDVPPVVIEKKITSAVCVPMMFEEDVLGVLIGHTLARRIFTEEELSLYQNIANQAAVAIENSLHLKEQQKLTSIIESTSDFIGMATLEGEMFYLNPAGRALVGIDSAVETRRKSMAEYVMKEDRRTFLEIMGLIEHQREWKGELHFRHFLTDQPIPVEMNLFLIRDKETGGRVAIAVIARDLTDHRLIEQELIKAQKLESLGVLAGGIAHDFNNLLTAMLGNIVLAKTHAGSENIAEWMKEAERAAIRAKDLARQLITFSRGGMPVKAVIAIGSIIEEAARFALLGSRAQCEFFLPDDLWPIEADAGQIGQVVNNLLINANQAMPEGGTVSIVGDNLIIGEETLLPLQPGPYVRVMLRDTGIGMTKELLSKIFDPYFTTKQTGSGLGLATSYSIMKKHNGHIAVESRLGAGTTFTLYLPAAPGKREKEPGCGGQPIAGSGNILLMDDDDGIRAVAKELLEFLGYNVTAVPCGEEAVEAYKKTLETGSPYDVVITDLIVPGGMGGEELVRELCAIDPYARVIVSSGYSNDPIMASFREHGFSGVVVKPYTDAELAEAVNAVIHGERGQSPDRA